jgi:hypothetical protein
MEGTTYARVQELGRNRGTMLERVLTLEEWSLCSAARGITRKSTLSTSLRKWIFFARHFCLPNLCPWNERYV